MCSLGQNFDQVQTIEIKKEEASELAAYLLQNQNK